MQIISLCFGESESDSEIRVDLEAPGGESDVLVLAVRWRLVGVLGG